MNLAHPHTSQAQSHPHHGEAVLSLGRVTRGAWARLPCLEGRISLLDVDGTVLHLEEGTGSK